MFDEKRDKTNCCATTTEEEEGDIEGGEIDFDDSDGGRGKKESGGGDDGGERLVRVAVDIDNFAPLGTGERDGRAILDGVAGRVGKRGIESNGARVHLSFAVETRYFYRRERYQGAVRSRNDGRTILGVLENANDFSHPTVGVTVGDYSWYSRRLSSRRRHVIVMLRLSRANVAQNEHFRFERGDVGYSRAEVLGDAVLRGHFEQSVGREVVVTRRVGETERGVEIWVDRRGVRGRDVRETSDGDCRKNETSAARWVREDKGKFERRICRAMVSVRMRRRGEGRFSNVVRTSHREAAKTGFRWVEKRSRSKKSVFEVVMFLSHLVLVLVVVGF